MGSGDSKPVSSYQEFIKLMRKRNITQILTKEYHEVRSKEQYPVRNVETRILLKENKSGCQISANFVDGWTQRRRFICTEPPREKTAFQFWSIIFKHQVRIIVMMRNNSDEYFYKYWKSSEGAVKTIRQFTIETVKVIDFQNYQVTTLNVNNNATGEFLEVIHFACTDWAQFYTVQGSVDFTNFVHNIRSTYEEIKNELLDKKARDFTPPIVIHCRSDLRAVEMFCAMDISISEYYANHTISLPQTFLKLLKQKYNSCVTLKDYLFYYQLMFRFVTLVKAEEIVRLDK